MPSKSKTATKKAPAQPAQPAQCPSAILDQFKALLVDMEQAAIPTASTSPQAPAPVSDTTVILAAIEQSRTSLLVRIDHLAAECNLIRADLDKFRGRLSETESRISATEDLTTRHDDAIHTLQRTVQSLVAKSDDAENRLRRNNVRVLGLPEGAEGDHPAEFAEAFFKKLLNLTEVTPTYVVERAHRVPTGRSIPGAPPRPFLVRFLNFRDRDRILREARKHPTLPFEHTVVHLYPDFSADLQRRRKTFTDIRRRLRERDIKYSMLYPSRLRVQHGGSVKFFDSPDEANTWLLSLQ